MAVISLLAIYGCSGPKEISYSQTQLQEQVDVGFLSPQIRSFDLQPFMVVQLYLETPALSVQRDLEPLLFRFHGKMDAEFFGGPVTKALPFELRGVADLVYQREDTAVFLDQVRLLEARVDLDLDLIQVVILEQFQQHLVRELERIPVISISQVPELKNYLSDVAPDQQVRIFTLNERVLFEIEDK